jgi:exopolysaccharide production protein ExoZ
VLALYLVLSLAVPSQSKLPAGWQVLPYLTANLLLLPGIFPIEPIITVAWSLSYEMFFYLLMPAAISGFVLRRRTASFRMAFLVVSGMLAAAVFSILGGPVRMLMFVAGALLFEVLPRRPAPMDWPAPAGLGLALLAVAWPSPGALAQVLQTLAMAAGFFALCWVCFSRAGSAAAKLATWLPLRWLGNMSYSYYLIHGLALKASFMVLSMFLPPGQVPQAAATLLMPAFLITLLPSVLLFLWVERPWSLVPGTQRASPVEARG